MLEVEYLLSATITACMAGDFPPGIPEGDRDRREANTYLSPRR
jgi:hypothetical protein